MQVEQVRVDLLDVHSTVELLRGLPKNPEALFSFLTAKAPYNSKYGEVERLKHLSIGTPPLSFLVGPADEWLSEQNFWRGKGASSQLSYQGYVGDQPLDQVAWQKFVPFHVHIPLEATTLGTDTDWTIWDSSAYLWSCGWAISLQLSITASMSLEDLLNRVSLLKTRAVPITLGNDQTSQSIWSGLSTTSQWIQDRLVQPVLQRPLPQPKRFGPFMLIAVEWSPEQPSALSNMDEQSKRLIYALTSQDPAWKSYSATKIKDNFKETDIYPGSFIFMDRMGRFFSFPALKGRARKLDCYVQNTKAAMMMMITLSQFIRLLAELQTGSDLKANYPLRDLFTRAVKMLEEFPSFYRNTNVKRLARDLDIANRISDARARLA